MERPLHWIALWQLFFPICSRREGVEKILGELSTCTSEDMTFGKTKIFIKSPKTVSWRVHLYSVGAEELDTSSA